MANSRSSILSLLSIVGFTGFAVLSGCGGDDDDDGAASAGTGAVGAMGGTGAVPGGGTGAVGAMGGTGAVPGGGTGAGTTGGSGGITGGSGGITGGSGGITGGSGGTTGGSGGTTGGGSGGTTGGGTSGGGSAGTGGGTSPLCVGEETAATGDNPLIDDLEDGDGAILLNDNRDGEWFIYNDESDGGEQNPTGEFAAYEDGANGSSYSARTWGNDGFTVWGAGIGLSFNAYDDHSCPYDASIYEGIHLCAKGIGTARFRVEIAGTVPVSSGGTCPDEDECYNHYGEIIALTEDWECHDLAFADLSQEADWGVEVDFDATQLMALSVQVPEGEAFDIYLDDVSFYPDRGTGGTGGTGGAGGQAGSAGTSGGAGLAGTAGAGGTAGAAGTGGGSAGSPPVPGGAGGA